MCMGVEPSVNPSGGHFCTSCGRRKTECTYIEGGSYCTTCGMKRPLVEPLTGKPLDITDNVLSDDDLTGTTVTTRTGDFEEQFRKSMSFDGEGSERAGEGAKSARSLVERRVECYVALPSEVLIMVFSNLHGLRDLVSCSQVCRQWREVASDGAVWMRFALRRWPFVSANLLGLPKYQWQGEYIRRHKMWKMSTEHPPTNVADALAPCGVDFNLMNPRKSPGRVFDTRICEQCDKVVVCLHSLEEQEVLVRNGVLTEGDLKHSPTHIACAYHVRTVPSAHIDWGFAPWYFGLMSRDATMDVLLPCPDGTFLVRESRTRPKDYCLSVKIGPYVHHIRIMKDQMGYSIGMPFAFRTIPELVEFYTKKSLDNHFRELPTKLRHFSESQAGRDTFAQYAGDKPLPPNARTSHPYARSFGYLCPSKDKSNAISSFVELVREHCRTGQPVPLDIRESLIRFGIADSMADVEQMISDAVARHRS